MTAAQRLRELADGPDDQVEDGLRRDIRDVLAKLEEADLERARLIVERDIKKGRRLLDGTVVLVGMRVVLDRAACTRHGLAHGWDDKVHEITDLLGGDCGLVECGPRQINTGHLRLAPPGAEVSCGSCAGWRAQMARMRAEGEAFRLCQVSAFGAAARKLVSPKRHNELDMEWSQLLDAFVAEAQVDGASAWAAAEKRAAAAEIRAAKAEQRIDALVAKLKDAQKETA